MTAYICTPVTLQFRLGCTRTPTYLCPTAASYPYASKVGHLERRSDASDVIHHRGRLQVTFEEMAATSIERTELGQLRQSAGFHIPCAALIKPCLGGTDSP